MKYPVDLKRERSLAALAALSLSLALTLATLVSPVSAAPSSQTNTGSTTCDKYAAVTGSDSGTGASTAPFKTVQKLIDSLSAGQTGCLQAGTYDSAGNRDIKFRTGGAVGKPVTLTSAPGGRATIRGWFMVAETASDVVVSNLFLDGRNPDAFASPSVWGDRVTFTGVEVTNYNTAICFGIGSHEYGKTPSGTVIERSRIHNCGRLPATNYDHGIYVSAGRNTRIVDNYIYDNADRGIQLYPDAQNTVIVNNVIDGNGEGIIISGGQGYASSNNYISSNIITNATIRYNVESHWPTGNPVPRNNLVEFNCLYQAQGRNVQASEAFVARDNMVADPLYVDRVKKNFHLKAGSPCAGKGPRA